VIINLATNDFGQQNPDEAGWTKAYGQFISRVRKNYPNAWVYCAIGPMMSDNWPPNNKALSTVRRYIDAIVSECNRKGDKRVSKIEFPVQDIAKDGGGAAYHPNLKTNRKMANQLIDQLKRDLGW
jgi:hypothetical protein